MQTNDTDEFDTDEKFITLPASKFYPVDLSDRVLNKLRTTCLALSPDNATWRDEDEIFSAWAVLCELLEELKPLRENLNKRGAL
ncbi:MAG TPA: hypothetical protein PKD49_05770 [Hyphomicrobium sp.]|nr:hypothetical protein [Hyphomicrobium sp.]